MSTEGEPHPVAHPFFEQFRQAQSIEALCNTAEYARIHDLVRNNIPDKPEGFLSEDNRKYFTYVNGLLSATTQNLAQVIRQDWVPPLPHEGEVWDLESSKEFSDIRNIIWYLGFDLADYTLKNESAFPIYVKLHIWNVFDKDKDTLEKQKAVRDLLIIGILTADVYKRWLDEAPDRKFLQDTIRDIKGLEDL